MHLFIEETGSFMEDYEEEIRKQVIDELNAHFLFNALSYICGAEKRDPGMACELTKEFGDYLRGAMRASACMGEWILLADELKPVKAYLHIQELRFKGRVKSSIEIIDDGQMVLAGSVRALVEDAVSQRILKTKDGGAIRITQSLEMNKNTLYIEENGFEADTDAINDRKELLRVLDDTEGTSLKRDVLANGIRTTLTFPR